MRRPRWGQIRRPRPISALALPEPLSERVYPLCLLKAGDDPVNIYFDYDGPLDGVHQAGDTQYK